MEFQEYALAKDLARLSSDLDQSIRKFVVLAVESMKQPRAEEFGVNLAAHENSPFALTATCHRRIVDVEFENAIYQDPEFRNMDLIAHIKLFLRLDGAERQSIPSPLFMYSGGRVHLLRDFVLNVHDPMLTPNDINTFRTSLSELVLKSVHPTLPFYPKREDIK